MSHQFRLYLLPTEVESLVSELQRRVGVRILDESSPTREPVEINSPIRDISPSLGSKGSAWVRCCLTPTNGGRIGMLHSPARDEWIIQIESDVIQISGMDYDGRILLCGRFYYQNDILVGDTIVPKRPEFLTWADRVFRIAKKLLRRSSVLNAYVGHKADAWRRDGGKFVELITEARGPIYAPWEQ